MKILRVIASVDRRGGGPIEGITQSATALERLGCENEVVSLDAPDAPFLDVFPLPTYAIGPGALAYGYAPRLEPWLRDHAREYDAVIVHGLWNYVSYGAWRALRGGNVPYFIFPHGMLDPYFQNAYPLKRLKKWAYWRVAEQFALRDARAVLFTCEQEKLLAAHAFRPYVCNPIVVHYGTAKPADTGEDASADREAFLARHPELRGKRILLFLSRIHPKKGCDILLDAFATVAAQNPDLYLVMAGPDQGGWKATLQARARRLGLDPNRVLWPGMLTGALKWGAFRAADAFVLPSHQENFGIAVAEALARGCPVLITDKVNIWQEIKDGGAGLVEADTVDGVTRLLQNWLALSPEAKDEMRRAAERTFLAHFEITQSARDLLHVLQNARAETP